MAISFTSGALTALAGATGILLGAVVGPYINHRLGMKNTRKDLLFKRKIEYFEKLAITLEQNIRMYKNHIGELEAVKNGSKEILKKIKEERKNYLVMASPLYFDIDGFSPLITEFVSVEKIIFQEISKINKKSDKNRALPVLKERLNNLIALREKIISEMKKELKK